jgi:hypothetical protein
VPRERRTIAQTPLRGLDRPQPEIIAGPQRHHIALHSLANPDTGIEPRDACLPAEAGPQSCQAAGRAVNRKCVGKSRRRNRSCEARRVLLSTGLAVREWARIRSRRLAYGLVQRCRRFWRVFFARTGVHFARKRSNWPCDRRAAPGYRASPGPCRRGSTWRWPRQKSDRRRLRRTTSSRSGTSCRPASPVYRGSVCH